MEKNTRTSYLSFSICRDILCCFVLIPVLPSESQGFDVTFDRPLLSHTHTDHTGCNCNRRLFSCSNCAVVRHRFDAPSQPHLARWQDEGPRRKSVGWINIGNP